MPAVLNTEYVRHALCSTINRLHLAVRERTISSSLPVEAVRTYSHSRVPVHEPEHQSFKAQHKETNTFEFKIHRNTYIIKQQTAAVRLTRCTIE